MTQSSEEIPERFRRRSGRRNADSRRIRKPARLLLAGIAIAVVIGVIGASMFTQTTRGREQVLQFTLRMLGGRLNGDLDIQRLDGNVLTGARLYGISLTDTTGAPLAVADSAYIQYRLPTFLGGDVVINRLVLYDAEVNIFRLPGDTLWNYQHVLTDPTPGPEGPPGATLIERMEVHNTRLTVRAPLEADQRLSIEDQQLALAETRADTARFMLEEVEGGTLRTMLFNVSTASVQELFIGADERGGTYLEVVSGAAEVRMWKDPPLLVQDVQLQLHLQEGILNYEAPLVLLPNSRGESVGRIDLRGDRPLYDIVITSPSFVIADLRFLYPWLRDDPAAGGGSGRLWVEDRDEELAVVARDVDLEMPGTHITGQFGMLVGLESLRFVDVDLEAEPLRVESVEQLLPEDLPVEGLEIGGAVIRGES